MGTIETREYAQDTSVTQEHPWGFYIRARVMCPDGIVRATARIAMTADTFFSVPCAVNVRKGRILKVSGYMTIETVSGSSVVTDDDPAIVKFRPYTYGKNAGAFDIPATVQRRGANGKFIAA